jgi:transcriptional regulator with XRE-family HTH domain
MTLPEKIARLVAERGWNQETFARQAGLNRITVRQILQRPEKRLRNQTIKQCADALGLAVNDLLNLPMEKLLLHVRRDAGQDAHVDARLSALAATQPELQAWLERHPARAATLGRDEIDELGSLQGTGGPLTQFGVEHFVKLLERKRELKRRVDAIAGTEYLDLVEQLIGLVYDKIRPYAQRK